MWSGNLAASAETVQQPWARLPKLLAACLALAAAVLQPWARLPKLLALAEVALCWLEAVLD